jgi:type IV secretion system protein VirD4
VVLGSLLRSVMRANGRIAGNVPFLIDETYQLKHMQVLADARDQGRKFGIPLYSMWQSEGQIEEVWGGANGKKEWFNTAAWRMYIGGVDDPITAKELSATCGTYTILVPSQGSSLNAPSGISQQMGRTRGTNAGLSLAARRLVTDDELRTGFRADEALVLFKNQLPARFGLPFWHRRQDMAADLKPNPFLQEAMTK